MFRISSAALACVLLISIAGSGQDKTATASISGKITLKNKGVAGIVVLAHQQNDSGGLRASFRGTTDDTGNYRITNLPAGTYVISPITPSLALADEMENSRVVVNEGESVEDVNFAVVPGAVITGRISDVDGKPLIEEPITLSPIDARFVDGRLFGGVRTDDRGIYRVFGLRAGKYKVSVGRNESLPNGPRPTYRQTFYPSVTDVAKATVIEVTEGSEATNIDITVGRPVSTFKVSGRVLDAETEQPLQNIKYGVYQSRGESGGSSMVGQAVTNAKGEFILENVLPGKYSVFLVPEESGVREDSVSFEVVDRDVADLLIKAARAASVSGFVVFEGAAGSAQTIKANTLYIHAWVESRQPNFSAGRFQLINPDGSFRLGGLQKGIIHFGFQPRTMKSEKPIEVVRVERDGVVQPNGLILNDGEQVNGLRLVVKYLTGAIRGQVMVDGDELPSNAHLTVWINYMDDNSSRPKFYTPNSSPQLDSRRRFAVEGLAAGTYEINVAVFEPNRQDTTRTYKQQVTVADNAVSEVTITIKNKP